jgi:flagellar assembly protein FliH
LYLVQGAEMNLSRFYKTNKDFQVKTVLQNTTNAGKEPVWKSIVKEEEIVPEQKSDNKLDSISSPAPPHDTPLEDHSAGDAPEAVNAGTELSAPAQTVESAIDVEGIRDSAFTAGVAAGKKQAEKDFEDSAQTLLCICTELDRLRESIFQNSAGEMKELVLAISEKIIRHSVTEQEETIVATIKDAMNLAVKSDAFQVQINPDDLKAVESHKKEIIDAISGLDNIILKPDATIERGGCKLESTCCTVDASLTSQIKIIHDSIMAADSFPKPEESE